MKKPFTQYRSTLGLIAKKNKLSEAETMAKITKLYANAPAPLGDMEDTVYVALRGAESEMSRSTHIFIQTKVFSDWLVDSFPENNAKENYESAAALSKNRQCVVHFPCGTGLDSFMFFITKETNILLSGSYGSKIGDAIAGDSWFIKTTSDLDVDYYLRLICSIGLYVDCFPECVIQKLPEIVKHPSHHKYENSIELLPSEKIKASGTHASPSAHFRSGHFRFLKSEKFTGKRFQTVFVSQAFVNGRAKTILSPDELQAK
jgi:hypothetical protein